MPRGNKLIFDYASSERTSSIEAEEFRQARNAQFSTTL